MDTGRSSSASSSSIPSTVNSSSGKDGGTSEVMLKYSNILLLSLFPIVVILLLFGGRTSVLCLCFGSIFAYIFDILGIIECTVLSILLMCVSLWISLIWAGRLLLNENSFHFSIIAVMGAVIAYMFILMMSYFKSFRNEFDSLIYCFEDIMFATIPLIGTSILTWFLCLEVQAFDMPTCFSIVYFLYTLVLVHPRVSSHPGISEIAANIHNSSSRIGYASGIRSAYDSLTPYVLSSSVLKLLYSVPVVVSPIIFVSIHLNTVFYWNITSVTEFFTSLLLPLLLMVIAAEHHHVYWKTSKNYDYILTFVKSTKVIVTVCLFLCLQDHPLFDDIKAYSGLNTILSSTALCAIGILLFAAHYLHRNKSMYTESQMDFIDNFRNEHGITNVFITACMGAAAILTGIMMNASLFALVNCGIWAITTAELYQLTSPWSSRMKILLAAFLTMNSAMSAAFIAFSFTFRTVLFLTIDFTYFGFHMNMQQFCLLFTYSIALAIAVPSLALGYKNTDGGDKKKDYILPSNSDTLSGNINCGGVDQNGNSKAYMRLFSFLFQVCVFLFAAVESVVREQDWSKYNLSVDTVYPPSMLVVSAILLVVTTMHLCNNGLISVAGAWVVLVTQIGKLFILVGVPSAISATAASIMLNFTMPFIVMVENVLSASVVTNDITAATDVHRPKATSPLLILFYVLSAAGSTCWGYNDISRIILSSLLTQEPTAVQRICLCVSVWTGFVALIGLVFYKHAALLRSLFFIVSLVCAVVASNALPLPTFTIDPTSSTYIIVTSHPELSSEHGGIFLVISLLLLVAATLNIVNINKPIPRLLFVLMFTYTMARFIMTAAFPLALNAFSPHHGMLQLPWMYCVSSVFLASLVSLRSTASAASSSIITSWLYVLVLMIPMFAVLISFLNESLHEHYTGIVSVAILISSSICIFARVSEFLTDISKLQKGGNKSDAKSLAASFCVMSSLLSILWTVVASFTIDSINPDYAIPLSCMLFLFTKRNVFIDVIHPVELCAAASSVWWTLSSLYSLFIKGYSYSQDGDLSLMYTFITLNKNFFGDKNISVWSSDVVWYMPLANMLLVILPIPAIVLSLSPSSSNRHSSEDVMFMLSILSALSIILASINSIRLLGAVGMVAAALKCSNINRGVKDSNRLI